MSTPTVDVESIERLADKVKDLIGLLERTRGELSQTIEDNLRLSREIEHLRDQVATAENAGAEVSNLIAEREQIRAKVEQMLEQIEQISV